MKAFTPLILIALTVAAYFMYIQPTFTEVQALNDTKNQYADVLQKAKDLAAKRNAILSQYNAVSPDDIARLKKIVPEQTTSVDIAKHISTVASKYGIVVKSIKVTEPVSDDRVVTAPSSQLKNLAVTFVFQGSYNQFVNFLKDLESGLFLMDVTNLSITPVTSAKSQDISSYNYSVGLLTYSIN